MQMRTEERPTMSGFRRWAAEGGGVASGLGTGRPGAGSLGPRL